MIFNPVFLNTSLRVFFFLLYVQREGKFALARDKTEQANKKAAKRSLYKQQVRHYLKTRSREVESKKHGPLSDTEEEVTAKMWRAVTYM